MQDDHALVTLRQNLNTYFDVNEIRALCFELGVDSEQLPVRSLSKDELVRELIRYEAQQKRLPDLVAACNRLRPNNDWPLPSNEAVDEWLQIIDLSPTKAKKRSNQLLLLEKVKRIWIQGLLEKSTMETSEVGIQAVAYGEAIENPWHDVAGMVVYDAPSLTLHENLLDTFSEADRALLILGEAGTGKTTTLLKLCRELVALAEQANSKPIPVVLSLVSWTERQKSIAEWVIAELNDKYRIPGQLAREWLAADELLLLLDSLDEVPLKYREDCIEAINQFRTEQGLTGLAVCSRINEYEAAGAKLKLSGAILLQTLTPNQIDAYLAKTGSQNTNLRRALHQDEMLLELAKSPLTLNIMIEAYSDNGDSSNNKLQEASSSSHINTNEEYRQHLFATYVERMFQRSSNKLYDQEDTMTWLTWLAQKMSVHNQAIFLIESLQPSWLPTRRWRWLYIMSTRLLDGIYIGLLLWLYLNNKQGVSQFVDAFTDISQDLDFITNLGNLWPVIALNMILGLIVGVIDIGRFEKSMSRGSIGLVAQRRWQMAAVNGIVAGLVALLIVAILGHPFESLSWGTLECVLFLLASFILHGSSYRDDVRSVEALRWRWSVAIKAGLVGLVVGVISGIVGLIIYETNAGLRAIPAWVLLFALIAGLQGRKIETKSVPNQGTRLSARNGLISALLFFIPFTLFGFVLYDAFKPAIVAGLTVSLGAFLLYGGSNVVKHYLIVVLLWLTRKMPWAFSHFLDSAVELLFLHRVGGGYIYIHRLLQDYFSHLADKQGDTLHDAG